MIEKSKKTVQFNLIRVIVVSLGLVVVGFSIPVLLGGVAAINLAASLSLYRLAGLFLVMFIVWNLNLIRLRVLLDGQTVNLGYWRMLRIYLATEFFSKTTPMGAGAPAAAVALLAQHGVKAASCLVIFGIAACMDAVVLVIFIFCFLFAGLGAEFDGNIIAGIFIITSIMIAVIFGTYMLLYKHKSLARLMDYFLQACNVGGRKRHSARKLLVSLHRAFERVAKLPAWRQVLSWAACVLYWMLYLSTLYLSIISLGGSISWLEAGFIQMVAMGIGHLLMIPGGVGGAELSGALLLAPLMGAAVAGSAILVWRFFMLYLYLIVGGASLLSLMIFQSPSRIKS